MEAYLLENASTYRDLVAKSALELAPKPAAAVVAAEGADEAGAGTELADTDIVITARIRPVLDDEVAGGQLPGVFQRVDDAARVEVHEMRRPVKPTAPPIFTVRP
jgi:kinesin family protein 2/24